MGMSKCLLDFLEDGEEAIPVLGYGGDYWVTSLSRVISLKYRQPRALAQAIGSAGYPQVELYRNNKGTNFCVHSLVASAFLGDRPSGMQVRHLDGDRTNTELNNLVYGTPAENQADRDDHGTDCRGEKNERSKLTAEDVISIRRKYATGQYTQVQLGSEYDVSHVQIGNITSRRHWTHI